MTEIEIPVSRIAWSELPISVRGEIESRLGAGVRSGSTQPGGFSRGMASRLAMVDGRTVFAKAIPIRDRFAHRYRIEGDTATQLPAEIPAPAVRFMLEIDGWRVLVFDDVTGRHPRFDQPTELAAVLAVVEDMARMLTPNPLPDVPTLADDLGSDLSGWRKPAYGELAGNLTSGRPGTWIGSLFSNPGGSVPRSGRRCCIPIFAPTTCWCAPMAR